MSFWIVSNLAVRFTRWQARSLVPLCRTDVSATARGIPSNGSHTNIRQDGQSYDGTTDQHELTQCDLLALQKFDLVFSNLEVALVNESESVVLVAPSLDQTDSRVCTISDCILVAGENVRVVVVRLNA